MLAGATVARTEANTGEIVEAPMPLNRSLQLAPGVGRPCYRFTRPREMPTCPCSKSQN
jgi:hypothetical protein